MRIVQRSSASAIIFLALLSPFATSSSHAATTTTTQQQNASSSLRGSRGNSRDGRSSGIRGGGVNDNSNIISISRLSSSSNHHQRRILKGAGKYSRPGTSAQGRLRDHRDKKAIKKTTKFVPSIKTILPETTASPTTAAGPAEPSSIPTPILFVEAAAALVAPTDSPTLSPVIEMTTPRPTWTFSTQSPTKATVVVEVCEYCSNRCFDDTAVVQFTQGSQATCAQVRTKAPSLTRTQCEIERPKIEESCCCSPPIVSGRLNNDDDNGNGDGSASACTFCVGRNFVEDNSITFSNGSDMVTCSGLRSLVRSGLSTNFCTIEKAAIEASCCEELSFFDEIGQGEVNNPTVVEEAQEEDDVVEEVEVDTKVDAAEVDVVDEKVDADVDVDAEVDVEDITSNVTDVEVEEEETTEREENDDNDNDNDNDAVLKLLSPEEFAAAQQADRPATIVDGSDTIDQEQEPAVVETKTNLEQPVAEEEQDESDGSDKGKTDSSKPSTIKDGGKRENGPIASVDHIRPHSSNTAGRIVDEAAVVEGAIIEEAAAEESSQPSTVARDVPRAFDPADNRSQGTTTATTADAEDAVAIGEGRDTVEEAAPPITAEGRVEDKSSSSSSNSNNNSIVTASPIQQPTTSSSRFDNPLYDPNNSRNQEKLSSRTTSGQPRIPMFDRQNAVQSF